MPVERHEKEESVASEAPDWLEHLPLAAYVCDASGRVIGHNRRAARLWGRRPAGGDTRWCGALRAYGADGKPLSRAESPAAVALRTGEEQGGHALVIERPDGSRRAATAHARPLIDAAGRPTGVVCVLVEEPEAPAQTVAQTIDGRDLDRKGERLRILWEAASSLLSADDPDGMLRDLFARIGPHLGVDLYFNFMLDETGEALRLASCAGVPMEVARTFERLELGQAICGTVAQRREPIVATCIQASDEPMVQLVKSLGVRAYACNPLIFDGKLLGTLSFASRARDRFDPEEIEFVQTISQFVTVAYGRLTLVDRLLDADRRKDEFLATLAHELRNPLAPVRNAVHVLRSWGSDEPELRWCRDVIDRQVEHLTRLIDDLVDLSRITRDKLELETRRMDLSEAVHAATETCRWGIEQAKQTLSVALPPGPVVLDADPVRLTQMLVNLLDNASKFSESGGHICLTADREDGEVVVRVTDTGAGIPAPDLARVFDVFFQVDRSLERSRGGLGIGLSLARKIVALHGGRIEARSAGAGKGSEFVVRLPLGAVEAPAPSGEPRPPREIRGPEACRILIVDDNRDSVDSLAMLLQLSGVEAHTAYDGQAAVECAARLRPDVVLLDIGMPKLSGYDACRMIRELPGGGEMVLIAVTGWGQEEDRRRSREAGFDVHMVKPVDPTELMRQVTTLRPGLRSQD